MNVPIAECIAAHPGNLNITVESSTGRGGRQTTVGVNYKRRPIEAFNGRACEVTVCGRFMTTDEVVAAVAELRAAWADVQQVIPVVPWHPQPLFQFSADYNARPDAYHNTLNG